MQKKPWSVLAAGLLLAAILISGCGSAAAPGGAPRSGFLACQVTDTGRIDDRSFNAATWKGIQDAVARHGIQGKYLESRQQTDFEKNISAFIEDDCDLIITVGFMLSDATQAAAQRTPSQRFSLVDAAFDPPEPNVLSQVFEVDQAAFLAGYLAAGMSRTGKVGVFGGMQSPPVTSFMEGYTLGAAYYNQQHGTQVVSVGWSQDEQTGLFIGNFTSTDDGRTMAENLMDEGVDVILPVAGPAGLGAAEAALARGGVYIIGVDTDWYESAPEYRPVLLSSIKKNMDVLTLQAIEMALDGSFKGGSLVGSLQNGGVSLAPYHDLAAQVPDDLQREIQQLTAALIKGGLPIFTPR